jgi:hypothetical protein
MRLFTAAATNAPAPRSVNRNTQSMVRAYIGCLQDTNNARTQGPLPSPSQRILLSDRLLPSRHWPVDVH